MRLALILMIVLGMRSVIQCVNIVKARKEIRIKRRISNEICNRGYLVQGSWKRGF